MAQPSAIGMSIKDAVSLGVTRAATPALRSKAAMISEAWLVLNQQYGLSDDEITQFYYAWRRPHARRGDTFLAHCLAIRGNGGDVTAAELRASAQAIAAAVQTLPIGRDIRARMAGLVDVHMDLLVTGAR